MQSIGGRKNHARDKCPAQNLVSILRRHRFFKTGSKSLVLLVVWQELVEAGLVARVSKDNSQWELGDLASEVRKDYGKNELGKYAEDVNMEKQTMKVYRYVASSYEKVIRITFSQLSFLHFQVVAAFDDRQSWLQLALDNALTVEELREKIRKSTRVDSPPLPDKKYRTVVIDPPWKYDFAPHKQGYKIERHYRKTGSLGWLLLE